MFYSLLIEKQKFPVAAELMINRPPAATTAPPPPKENHFLTKSKYVCE